MLVVLDDDKAASGIPEQEGELHGAVCGVNAADDSADALDAEVGVDPLLPVFGEDRDDVAPLQSECYQRHADGAGRLEEGLPGMALPDAEGLLAVCGTRALGKAAMQEQLWQRVAAVDEPGALARVGVRRDDAPVHGIGWVGRHLPVTYPQDFRRFQRRSPRRPGCSAPR